MPPDVDIDLVLVDFNPNLEANPQLLKATPGGRSKRLASEMCSIVPAKTQMATLAAPISFICQSVCISTFLHLRQAHKQRPAEFHFCPCVAKRSDSALMICARSAFTSFKMGPIAMVCWHVQEQHQAVLAVVGEVN